MRKSRAHLRPETESLESRWLPTSLVPTLTMARLRSVDGEVHRIMGTLAKNGDFNAAEINLVARSASIPFGRQQLAGAWQSDLATVDSSVPGSGLFARRQMIQDLYQHVQAGVQSGEFRVVGRGSEVFNEPKPRMPSSVVSIKFTNKTTNTLSVGGYSPQGVLIPGSLVTLKPNETRTMTAQPPGQSGVWTGIKVPPQTNFVYFSALLQNGGSYNITHNGGMWLVSPAS
ncbi:hypothetical protein [Paludisphaera rhizosphaerae]|uniref:hypothetical protein n=1 Tax=Paludisphaera rhizosphaerae TaxID=2711216 RepID=UPI0013ED1540|nr:hypothetical protein [Paludisphaera rhizosphaerae]